VDLFLPVASHLDFAVAEAISPGDGWPFFVGLLVFLHCAMLRTRVRYPDDWASGAARRINCSHTVSIWWPLVVIEASGTRT